MRREMDVSARFPESAVMEEIGIETLRRMRSVSVYNDWCYQAIEPYLGDSVLEVGCGIGNMTSYFTNRKRLIALDILPEAVEQVSQQCSASRNTTILLGDITNDAFVAQLALEPFDSCVSFNVLEHIRDDQHAMSNMARALRPGGYCALIIPAVKALYGTLDYNLGHYRRYEPQVLHDLVIKAGMEPVKISWMNFPGMFGWFVTSRVLRRPILPEGSLSLFNRLAPLFMKVESKWQPPIGQSLVCVARKV